VEGFIKDVDLLAFRRQLRRQSSRLGRSWWCQLTCYLWIGRQGPEVVPERGPIGGPETAFAAPKRQGAIVLWLAFEGKAGWLTLARQGDPPET